MSDNLVNQLKELGIAEKTARYALRKSNNDVQRAANYVRQASPRLGTQLTHRDNPATKSLPFLFFLMFTAYAGSDMAPLNRSFSLPVSLGDRVSRLKVFSGNAARDEVRDSPTSIESSPRPNLDPVPEHTVPQDTPVSTTTSLSDAEADGSDSDTTVESPVSEKKWGFRKSLRKLKPRRLGSGSASSSTVGLGLDAGDDERARGRAPIIKEPKRKDSRSRGNSLTTPLPSMPPLTPSASRDSQASSLILGALNQKEGGKEKKGASGAIGMLGLRAAAAATGNVTPPRTPETANTVLPSQPVGASKGGKSRRSASPFFRARRSRDAARKRDTSPEIGALEKERDESDGESISAPRKFRPQASAYEDGDSSGSEQEEEEEEEDGDEPFDDGEDIFDEETEANTLANAFFYEGDAGGLGGASYDDGRLDNYGEEIEQDILGEGPNVVVPPTPLFQQSLFQAAKKETTKSGLQLETSRPVYARDRCTIVLTHGDPDDALESIGKRMRRYVVLSDLSEESRYAVEWAIGTVARDGDEVFLISVKEDENRVDPKQWSNSDRHLKLRVQKERQTTCLLLTKQVAGLLQRTRLHITVTCQFLHAKNSRHMLLDLIDFLEPTMVIVGSRGLGKLKGILLGSTSHYLVQKSSVPIMVARRRLQRPLRKTNPENLRHAPRVSLASASIEKTASSKQEDEVVDVEEQEKAEANEARRASAQGGSTA